MPRTPHHLRAARAVASLITAAALTSCTTAPAIGPTPGNTFTAEPDSNFSTPPAQGLRIEINIDQKSVTPLQKEYDLEPGRTVVLITRSDHDTSLTVTGPGINRTDFIDRLSTISTTFVADTPGTISIKSTDPNATIATLTVG